jgi:hypothetical protein
MKKYLWSFHIIAGLLAILLIHEFSRLGLLFAVFSVAALLSLVAIYIAERLVAKK